MKIAILTQPLRYNFGGILQNYALQTVLRRMGHDVVTLDPHRYICKWWQYPILILRHTITRYIRRYREVPIFAEWFRDKGIRMLGTNTFRFINQNICRKEYWDLAKDIKEQDYDAFIVGSDQTWRWQYNRGITKLTNMFLDFTKGWKVKRIAYAASFGTNEWESDALKQIVNFVGSDEQNKPSFLTRAKIKVYNTVGANRVQAIKTFIKG